MPTRKKVVQGTLALLAIVISAIPALEASAQGQDLWLTSPIQGKFYISSDFGWRKMDDGTTNFHHGMDFAAPAGTPIVSVSDGFLVLSDWWPEQSRTNQSSGLGMTVAVYEPSSGLYTYYGHMSRFEFPNVTEAIPVAKGQVIGYVGSTGWSTGPHTHVGVSKYGPDVQNCWASEGCWLNPKNYLGKSPTSPVDDSTRPTIPQGITAPLLEPLVDEGPQVPIPIVEYESTSTGQPAAISEPTEPKPTQPPSQPTVVGLPPEGRIILLTIAGLGLALIFFGYLGRSGGAVLLGLIVLVAVAAAFVVLTKDNTPAALPPATPTTQPTQQPPPTQVVKIPRQLVEIEVIVTIFGNENGDVSELQYSGFNQNTSTQAATATSAKEAPSPGGCPELSGYSTNLTQYCAWIIREAQNNGLDPRLIAAVMTIENAGGNPTAVSRDGAVGLLQVMPSNGKAAGFQCQNGPCFKGRPTTAQLSDPEYNLQYGVAMLARLIDHFGSVREGLYHYGPTGHGYAEYADVVLGIYNSHK